MTNKTAATPSYLRHSQQKIQECVELLKDLVADTGQLAYLDRPQRIALIKAAGQLSRPQRDEIRKRKKRRQQAARRAHH